MYKSDLEIQLNSSKPDIREICKKYKTIPPIKFVIFENTVIFHVKVIYMNILGLLLLLLN